MCVTPWLLQKLTGPATSKSSRLQKPPRKTANRLPKNGHARSYFGGVGAPLSSQSSSVTCVQLFSLERWTAADRNICSSYPPPVCCTKWTLFSCRRGPSGGTAGTIPSPNTIRKGGDLFIQPFGGLGSEGDNVRTGLSLRPHICVGGFFLSTPPTVVV